MHVLIFHCFVSVEVGVHVEIIAQIEDFRRYLELLLFLKIWTIFLLKLRTVYEIWDFLKMKNKSRAFLLSETICRRRAICNRLERNGPEDKGRSTTVSPSYFSIIKILCSIRIVLMFCKFFNLFCI